MIGYRKLAALLSQSSQMISLPLTHMSMADDACLRKHMSLLAFNDTDAGLKTSQSVVVRNWCLQIDIGPAIVYPIAQGWNFQVLKARSRPPQHLVLSSALLDLVESCRMADFHWLQFDRNAAPLDSIYNKVFPIFDWNIDTFEVPPNTVSQIAVKG